MIITAIFVNNIVLAQFLGICPFLGVSKKVGTAGWMGLAVLFVMLIATLVTYPIYYGLLAPYGLGYMQTIIYILVIAALVQMVEIILKKTMPALYSALGVFLPLITTNCTILGVAINVINFGFDAIVGAMGNYYKEHGLPEGVKEGTNPYDYALKHDAMKHGRFNDIEVFADGEKLNEKQILLATLAQGQYVGGQFRCAPKSLNDDGLIDVCVLKTMTFLGLGMIIGTYTKGGHLDKPRKKIVYRRAKEIKMVSPADFDVCVDGEMVKGNNFVVKVLPGAVRLVLPE